jgi:hypothetical protein
MPASERDMTLRVMILAMTDEHAVLREVDGLC